MKRYLLLFLLIGCRGHGDSLAYLDAQVGQRPTAGFWDTEPLHKKLKDLLGDRYTQFVADMAKAGPLSRGKYLYLISPIDSGYAYLLIDTQTGKLSASMHSSIQIENFQSPGEAFDVPAEIQSKIEKN
jgi:hypothetical protein